MAAVQEISKQTKAAAIARQLSDDILSGQLAPGTALDETTIAIRYGVSRTPIREAIRQLAASGVVDSRPHRGAVVRVLSDTQLDEMFAVMAELEALCARASALTMTAAEQDHLASIVAESGDVVAAGDVASYVALNDRFHEAIYAGSHNHYLSALTLDTRAKLAPYRRVQFRVANRLAHSLEEHRLVTDAILARDGARAHAAMHAHLLVVRAVVDGVAMPR